MSKAKNVPNEFTNGWLSQLDKRTNIAQLMRARHMALTDDLGGSDKLSYQQLSLVERSLWLEYFLAEQEKVLATGGDFDSGRWTQAVNSLQGIYAKLGLDRVRQVKSVADYLTARDN